MALTTIKTGGLADNSVTDAKVADAITVTGAQTGITQVGTLTAGTWNAGVIASAYLDADTAHLSGSTFTGSVQISHGTTPDFTLNDTGGTTNKRVFRISGGGDAIYFEGRNNDNSGDGASGTIQTLSLSDASTTFAGDVRIGGTSITPSGDKSELVVQSASHGGISALGPDATEQGFFTGHASSNRVGEFHTRYDTNVLTIGSAKSGMQVLFMSLRVRLQMQLLKLRMHLMKSKVKE